MPAVRGHSTLKRFSRGAHELDARANSKPSVTVVLSETTIGGIAVPVFVTETITPSSSGVSSSSATSEATSSPPNQSSSVRSSSASSASQSSHSSPSSSSAPSSSSSASSTAQSSMSTSHASSPETSSQSSSATATPSIPSATFISSTASPTPTTFNNSNASSSTAVAKKGLSGGAIGGIVAGGAAVVLLLIVYFVRKRFLYKRQKRRNSWAIDAFSSGPAQPADGGNVSDLSRVPSFITSNRDNFSIRSAQPPVQSPPMQRRDMQPPLMQPLSLQQRAMQPPPVQAVMQPFNPYSQMSRQVAPPAIPFVPLPAAPPTAYNTPAPAVLPSAAPQFHPISLTPSAAPAAGGQTAFALIKSAFVPRLPDELSVSAGEMVRMVAEYDDGWARCANMRGEQGVVPLECLQRQRPNASGVQAPVLQNPQQLAYVGEGTGDWRMSQRESSLYPAQNPSMGY
ncbi:hypothetical protein SCP_1900150 [Sparassis crispa]|uniref:SH3 domain-containing protein n=1 Tax=Sparassis crispa TaxID=139825 RepID=A0A401H6U7_9APHY|nr:hypothetical protein SCP_1900150 [Sparassis crispa]GBE90166.1 hypothetical protein SCP_1900150 [Sparassis crispa]